VTSPRLDRPHRSKLDFGRIPKDDRLIDTVTVQGRVRPEMAAAIGFCKTYVGVDLIMLDFQDKAQYPKWRPTKANLRYIAVVRKQNAATKVFSQARRRRHAVEFLGRAVTENEMISLLQAHLAEYPGWLPTHAQLDVIERAMNREREAPRPAAGRAA
jgi:hypothetical protein